MEGSGSGGGGGGSPAPFLIKTYDMVDDASTNAIVSWSAKGNSFVVWNPQEFARILLPSYFKHNNFSSFIRQLNTYGFHKIDPERWEFANEDFLKDNKHLLKSIHRRKPVHSHSQPLSQPSNSLGDAERAALEEEIQKLRREKDFLLTNLARYRQQQEGTKVQLEKFEPLVDGMERRQLKLMQFLAKAVRNQSFIDTLIHEVEKNMQVMAINKKRRLPKADNCEALVNNPVDNQTVRRSLSTKSPNALTGEIESGDFSNKLGLELSPAVSDNLVPGSRHGSSDDEGNTQYTHCGVGGKNEVTTAESANESLELLDSRTSLAFTKNGSSWRKYSMSIEEIDGRVPCHLNLTLSSSPLQASNSGVSVRVCSSLQSRDKEANEQAAVDRKSGGNASFVISKEAPITNQASGRVNDVFWEQFLTERPGSSDTEEASSCFRGSPCEEHDERNSMQEKSWNSKQKMQQLTL